MDSLGESRFSEAQQEDHRRQCQLHFHRELERDTGDLSTQRNASCVGNNMVTAEWMCVSMRDQTVLHACVHSKGERNLETGKKQNTTKFTLDRTNFKTMKNRSKDLYPLNEVYHCFSMNIHQCLIWYACFMCLLSWNGSIGAEGLRHAVPTAATKLDHLQTVPTAAVSRDFISQDLEDTVLVLID